VSDFFRGQYDYIYFFYGLSICLLGVIAIGLARSRPRNLLWLLLGLFGLVHGANEWLEIVEINFGENRILSIIHLVVLAVSYLFLFEFARSGFLRLKGKILSRWVYLPIFILVFLGTKYGQIGLNATLRYFLGFPSGLFSAWIIYQAYKLEPKQAKPLLILSITLVSYALATGLVVSKVDFWPARWLNFDSFYQAVGIPVQFIRGILCLFSAMALWFYSPTSSDIKFLPQRYIVPFKPTKWLVLLSLVSLIGLGWIFTSYFDYYAGIQIIKNSKTTKNSPLNKLVSELSRLEKIAISISKSSQVTTALTSSIPADMEKAAVVLERYKTRFGALDCYLLDARGKIVATTGSDPSATVGKSFSSKTYFKDAISGNTGYYFVMGSTYNARNYYVSFPVRGERGDILGVVVIKDDISVEPVLQYRLIGISITLFVCILVIIFFSVLRRREDFIKLIEEANRQLQTVDKLKSDFISIVSHELRTPLTSIKNAVTILLKGGPNKRILDKNELELLEIILSNTNRQTRMISDLLDVSKIEAGVIDMRAEPVDIVALAQDVICSFQPEAKDKKINLKLSSIKESIILSIDLELTRRVFSNLIDNAIKFTQDNGEITVKIEGGAKDVRISVSDTGIGIPKDDLGKLFNKFYRARDIRAYQKGGSGLGLVIAKGLVEAQGGSIWVESKWARGSTFYFTLPAAYKKKTL